MLDLEATRRQLEEHASERGIDLAALINAGAHHFVGDRIVPATTPLSEEELVAEMQVMQELADWEAKHVRRSPNRR